uniref:Calcineurin-like phosphoesterase domain-containing protein n=1 Tax=Hanusia phi TaxID=3032 RepID=A0A7S0HTV5_9CRYP|mmetsp:Transcript_33470/g.75088  ORF Transcript_33470/g.75088 Transcript_33470/m.75088 type:complete len:398 (+) Transcript_33470:337-1530(+)
MARAFLFLLVLTATLENLAGLPDSRGKRQRIEAHLDGTPLPQPDRLVAIGDLHGDILATRRALRLAGVLHPERDEWVGGKTVVVQVGDQLDRGDDELQILSLLRKLAVQARQHEGALHVLIGNHEILSTHTARYATRGALENFFRWQRQCMDNSTLTEEEYHSNFCDLHEGPLECHASNLQCHEIASRMSGSAGLTRYMALHPGGMISRTILAEERTTALIVGQTLFVHAGIDLDHIVGHANPSEALKKINEAVSAFFRGELEALPLPAASTPDSMVWMRRYGGTHLNADTCAILNATLKALPGEVKRMVIGHTIQESKTINSACDGAVWRVDIGMSSGTYGTEPQILEIWKNGTVNVKHEERRENEEGEDRIESSRRSFWRLASGIRKGAEKLLEL